MLYINTERDNLVNNVQNKIYDFLFYMTRKQESQSKGFEKGKKVNQKVLKRVTISVFSVIRMDTLMNLMKS